MPLTFDLVAPMYMPDVEGQPAVNFRAHIVGVEPRELVSCRIHKEALEHVMTDVADRGVKDRPDDLLEAAERLSSIILRLASAKFDREEWELDGVRKVVMIRLADIPSP